MSRNKIGFWAVMSLTIGNTLGASIFLIPSSLASFGSISILGWVLTSVATILIAFSFARLSQRYPSTGGPYAFCHRGLGSFVGFQVAWNYWISLWVGNAGVLISLVGYLSLAFPSLAHDPWSQFIVLNSILWVLTILNAYSTSQSALLQMVTTGLKLSVLVMIFVGGLPHINMDNFTPWVASDQTIWSSLLATSTITMWALAGFESGTIPAGEVKEASNTIPRATIMGTLVVSLFYIIISTIVIGVVSNQNLVGSPAPFALVAQKIFGPWGTWAVIGGAIIASIGALNGMILIQGQIPLAAARNELFPKKFARTRHQGEEPVFGLFVSSALITALLAFYFNEGLVDKFTAVIKFAGLATLITFLFTVAADIILTIRDHKTLNKWHFVGSFVAIAYILMAFWGAGIDQIYAGFLLFFLGTPIYLILQSRRLRQNNGSVQEPLDSITHKINN